MTTLSAELGRALSEAANHELDESAAARLASRIKNVSGMGGYEDPMLKVMVSAWRKTNLMAMATTFKTASAGFPDLEMHAKKFEQAVRGLQNGLKKMGIQVEGEDHCPSNMEEGRGKILIGREAIAYAEKHGKKLNKYADPVEDARSGLTPGEARKVAAEDPGLIWIKV